MKKFLSVGLSALLIFSLSGCTFEISNDTQEQITELEEELALSEETIAELEEQIAALEEQLAVYEPAEEVVEETNEEPAEEISTVENSITLTSPANGDSFHEEPIEFTGTVSPNTEKIVVTAYYKGIEVDEDGFTRNELVDTYTLQSFALGDETFTYRAKMEWDNLGVGTNDYIFTAHYDDGSQMNTSVSIFFEVGGMAKPVIYLYPEEPTEVFVNVETSKGVFISDPEIGEGWNVVAYPDGKLYNLADQTEYPYLFWEGFGDYFETPAEGFVIAQGELNTFFDEKLTYLGLNETEITDFKEYWLLELNEDPYYFISFIEQDVFDEYAPLTVFPEPDTIIRVFFDYQGLDALIEVEEQVLTPRTRAGFTLTEWGGRLY